jgi:hypothetical protein
VYPLGKGRTRTKKKKQAANNMNKLKMFKTKQVTPDLTKNVNPFLILCSYLPLYSSQMTFSRNRENAKSYLENSKVAWE